MKILDLDYQDLLFLYVTHAHMHACTRTHKHKSAHKSAHDYIHIQANKGTPVRACVRERDSVCVCVCACVCERGFACGYVCIKVSVHARVRQ